MLLKTHSRTEGTLGHDRSTVQKSLQDTVGRSGSYSIQHPFVGRQRKTKVRWGAL